MGTLTSHLAEVYDVFPNTLWFGIPHHEVDALEFVLTDARTGHVLNSTRYGSFVVNRIKGWDETKNADVYGFRVEASDTENVDLVDAVNKANGLLAELDTTNPEAVWAVKPFWAN